MIKSDTNNNYPFELTPLPYAYNALEPYIDEKTMELHHDKHLQTYITNLNVTLKDYPELHSWSLEQLLYYSNLLPSEIRTAVVNNGGGVYNHNLFFANLTNKQTKDVPTGILLQAINADFGSWEDFKKEFKRHCLSVFGSGYTWLAACSNGKVHIVNTQNQDTVLPFNLYPIMLIDVWEHAYYLKHYNVRADYIDAWFNVVNILKAEENYNRVKL
ncbi:MAG: superoxide dismutase [Defluviitaleaceae bacterium]|nr:superoxide dismutase [Defluviitaleaceae bacterium]